MTIEKQLKDDTLTVKLSGRLDTTTAPEFEAKLKRSLDNVRKLELDFSELEYLSSSGLRVLLAAQKVMSALDGMTLRNVNESIMEIFEITGFVDVLNIV